MQNQYGWNFLEKPIKFNIKENTVSFSLAELPPKARKVQLYILLAFGSCTSDQLVTWNLSTKVDIIKISGIPYYQRAWNVQSVNCDLRLDERKIIEVSRIGNYPRSEHFYTEVEVLGYK